MEPVLCIRICHNASESRRMRMMPDARNRSHIDTHSAFEDGLISVSLIHTVVMDFKGPETAKALELPPRSALVLHGPSRYSWQHGIANRCSTCVYLYHVKRVGTLSRNRSKVAKMSELYGS